MKYILLLFLLSIGIWIIYKNNINHYSNRKNIYIISNILAGGSVKYLNDIINHYTHNNYIFIKNVNELNNINLFSNDTLFIQQIINTDITIDNIININKNNCKIYISIHDCNYLLGNNEFSNDVHDVYLHPEKIINSTNYLKIKKFFSIATNVIFPSKFIHDVYYKYFPTNNFIINDHIDYRINNNICVPVINDNTINIGNLSGFYEYKGKEYILLLKDKYKIYKNYNINFLIVDDNIPPYNEEEYYTYVKKYNMNGLLYLNKWGETWSYSLTKGLNTGLPICYNNIGSYKERIPNSIQYFKAFNIENDDINLIYTAFENMLDFIINNNGKYNECDPYTEMVYPSLYDNIFK